MRARVLDGSRMIGAGDVQTHRVDGAGLLS